MASRYRNSICRKQKLLEEFSLTCWIALNNANKENSIELMPRKKNSFKIYPQHYGRIGNVDFAKKN